MSKNINLDDIINEYSYNSKEKRKKVNGKRNKILLCVLVIVTITSIVCNIILLNNNYNQKELIKENNEEIYDLKSENDRLEIAVTNRESDLEYVIGDNTKYYVKEKLDFYDESVVFIIDGYGKYYYTYDCMMKKVGNKEYSFFAYNVENAKYLGYKKGGC